MFLTERRNETTEPAAHTDVPHLRLSVAHYFSGLTVWHLLYILLFVAAVLTRFWGLGDRALHHDESLHTYYSWAFAEGRSYTHHPMMHGPFLFHANALTYLLLGDNDFTSRVPAAIFGVILVMLPWFLRSPALLGRWGALAASTLLLVSPSILYYSRFIRHDIFAIVGAFLIFIAFIRYMEKPESRWIILAIVSVGFVLTTHEITFANLFIMGTFAGAWILYRVLPVSLLIIAGAGVLFLITRPIYSALGIRSIPEIPWESPSNSQVISYLGGLLTHPVVVTAIGLGVLAIIATLWLISRKHDLRDGWINGTLLAMPERSTAYRFGISLRDGRAWLIGTVAGVIGFAVLYTSLFSNLGGLGSGTFGAIGYWLAQHDVQRGQQPWFYYLVLAPQYEYLAILGALIGVSWIIWRARMTWKHGVEGDLQLYALLLIFWWAVFMFLVLSWAGEKMPWLIVHFLLPMILLAGAGIGQLIERLEHSINHDWPRTRSLLIRIGLPVVALISASAILLNWGSAGPFTQTEQGVQRVIRPEIADSWWVIYIPLILAIIIAAFAIIRIGVKRVTLGLGTSLLAMFLLLQINAGWSLSYRDGDVPQDMLIYVQTSPELHRTVRELEDISRATTGGMAMPVVFTSGAQWPLNWYLRNFTSRSLVSEIPAEPTAPFIFALPGEVGIAEEERLVNYSFVEMPLRWWIPEDETYRRFAIAPEVQTEWRQNLQTDDPPPYSLGDVIRSVGRSVGSVREPEQQARLFRLIVHRELSAPVGSFNVRLYIHDDVRHAYQTHRYQLLSET